jgi:hypothetical protein
MSNTDNLERNFYLTDEQMLNAALYRKYDASTELQLGTRRLILDLMADWHSQQSQADQQELVELKRKVEELTAINEGQAMRIGMYKSIDDEINKYTEDIDSLQKELVYARSVAEDYKKQLDLEKLYNSAETACKNIEQGFKNEYKKALDLEKEKSAKLVEALEEIQDSELLGKQTVSEKVAFRNSWLYQRIESALKDYEEK